MIMRLEITLEDKQNLLNEIANEGINKINFHLELGDDSSIYLSKDYVLQCKFFTLNHEEGVAISYKNNIFLNIYPSVVYLTIDTESIKAMEYDMFTQVINSLHHAVSNHIDCIYKLIKKEK